MMRFIQIFWILMVVLLSPMAHADKVLVQRQDVQHFITEMVKQGFDRKQLVAILTEAQYQPQIIESMDKPYEKKNWDVYKALFLTPERLQKGIQFWQNNQATLEKAQREYGVPAQVIVAIIGVETLYGEKQGNYRVLDALTTLAFYYPKRADFFRKELKEFLILCHEQKVGADLYRGSYAGAMGKPQFMPSSYRYFAVDSTGKGHRDLMNEDSDVIASVANYFHQHGWQMNEAVANPAEFSGDQYKRMTLNSKQANYQLGYLVRHGITPQTRANPMPHKAGILELITDKGQEYWLAYPNFYVITRYNTSPQYALAVYLLSEQLHSAWQKNKILSVAAQQISAHTIAKIT